MGIHFLGKGEVRQTASEIIEEQVSSCQAATCTCCTPVFREKVEEFTSTTSEDGVKVTIKGDITEEQVKKNILGCAPKLEVNAHESESVF